MPNTNWDDMEWDDDLEDFVPKKNNEEKSSERIMKDSNGKILETGDTVILTKDLPVKGSSINLKQGSKLKNIKIIEDDEHVEYKEGKTVIWVKTCFIKKIEK